LDKGLAKGDKNGILLIDHVYETFYGK